jgi:tryptophanase
MAARSRRSKTHLPTSNDDRLAQQETNQLTLTEGFQAILEVTARKQEIRGMRIVEEPPFLRHFSARFEPA